MVMARDARTLAPPAWQRVWQWVRSTLHGGFPHRVRLRRVIACGLVALAGVLVVAPRRGPAGSVVPVVVAGRDLPAGAVLRPGDVRRKSLALADAPDGALSAAVPLAGRVVAGAVRRGEVLTGVRLVGDELVRRLAGPRASAVPVRLADSAVADFVGPGATVDVVTADPDRGPVMVLASRAVVVTVRRDASGEAGRGTLLLVALPAEVATKVAGASLRGGITVTLR